MRVDNINLRKRAFFGQVAELGYVGCRNLNLVGPIRTLRTQRSIYLSTELYKVSSDLPTKGFCFNQTHGLSLVEGLLELSKFLFDTGWFSNVALGGGTLLAERNHFLFDTWQVLKAFSSYPTVLPLVGVPRARFLEPFKVLMLLPKFTAFLAVSLFLQQRLSLGAGLVSTLGRTDYSPINARNMLLYRYIRLPFYSISQNLFLQADMRFNGRYQKFGARVQQMFMVLFQCVV